MKLSDAFVPGGEAQQTSVPILRTSLIVWDEVLKQLKCFDDL